MEKSDSQSSSDSLHTDLEEIASAGSLSGGPPSELPDQAIEHESKESKNSDKRIEFADQTHQYIREYIQAADQKAAFFFAAFGVIVAYSNSIGVLDAWVVNISTWGPSEFIIFIHAALILNAALCCLWVVKPRLSGSKKGIIFFKSIAEYESADGFVTEFSESQISKLLVEKLQHTYEISKVCRDKYAVLGIGLWTGGIGTSLLMLVLLFGSET